MAFAAQRGGSVTHTDKRARKTESAAGDLSFEFDLEKVELKISGWNARMRGAI